MKTSSSFHFALLALFLLLLAACGGPDENGADPCAGVTRVCSDDAACGGGTCDACGRCATSGCSADTDCANGERCAGGQCIAACTSNDACGADQICVEGSCVSNDCTEGGCPAGLECRSTDGVCVECLGDNDCHTGDRRFCELDAGNCVGCMEDGDCAGNAAGARCSAALTCVECTSDGDCGGTSPRCRIDSGICAACSTDAHCPGSSCRADGTCDPGPEAGEACTPSGTCAAGLICADAICRSTCDLYAPNCPAGQGCGLLLQEGRAIMGNDGRPLAVCTDNSTGAGVNRPCGGTTSCRAGLFCTPESATGGSCKPFCVPGGQAEMCATGDECLPLPLGQNGENVGVCSVPTSWLDACTSDGVCDEGQGCTPYVQGNSLFARCQHSTGQGGALAPCMDSSDCRSNFCVPFGDEGAGFCFGTCEDESACGDGNHCMTYTFTLGGSGRTAPMLGCRTGCLTDAACSHFGADAICGVAVFDAQLAGICSARVGQGGAGANCTADNACGTGLCFDNGTTGHPADNGFCLGGCGTDLDCGPATQCREVALNVAQTGQAETWDSMQACWGQPCQRDAECPNGWACGLDTDPADPENALRTSCFAAFGDGMPGATCTTNLDCRTNICVPWDTTSVCWGPCVTNADCTAGTTCRPVNFTGSTTPLTACLPL